jgi:hypothetical protein
LTDLNDVVEKTTNSVLVLRWNLKVNNHSFTKG